MNLIVVIIFLLDFAERTRQVSFQGSSFEFAVTTSQEEKRIIVTDAVAPVTISSLQLQLNIVNKQNSSPILAN